jgi:excinuclease UvrABC ATPase subunit
MMLDQVESRLGFLRSIGLDYLTLDRPLKTLSGGEMQRVALTSALGSSLVNMLYVLDEPSVGLHPRDTQKLYDAVKQLRDRGNSVVVVEHEETFLRGADHLVETGPGAGDLGGTIIFQGSPREMLASTDSLTGQYLAGRRSTSAPTTRRKPTHGWIRLTGARGNNLKDITVEFPLGVLCVVAGVSGAGKSTLVEDTLYPALCRRMRKESEPGLPFNDCLGDGQIDDVTLVDQSPIGRSPRSNPVTYIKAFDAIRNVFAETLEARTHNYTAGHFSFNVDGGRCSACEGDGFVQIDMQFLADVFMRCSQCQGKRYRREILDVTYRGKNIADVLEMSVRSAFSFFRGQEKVQIRLKRLMDVGLDYLKLGQPANTLSAGEAQRLKLAGYLAGAKRQRTLFLLDEPTTGLHFSDIVRLLDCFDALLASGHSLIVVEHNLQLMKAADYIIDLGPGAGVNGGRVVAAGTLPELLAHADSLTGQMLKALETKTYPTRGERRPVNVGQAASLPAKAAKPAKGNKSNDPGRLAACPTLVLHHAAKNNLKDLTVHFPLGRFIAVTGVSGSGKSTLIKDCLFPAVEAALAKPAKSAIRNPQSAIVSGFEVLNAVHEVDQSPIGRTPRSTPATYVGFFDDIRQLFASATEAKLRGYGPGRFSFNSAQGRCPDCEGKGVIELEMNFLPTAQVKCERCGGGRFNPETLDVTWQGKSIADVLNLSVAEALEFFAAHRKLLRPLEALHDTGLDYLRLGQTSPTLSGGEAQRIKLVSHLLGGLKAAANAALEVQASKFKVQSLPKRDLFILEEPTIGLHMQDVRRLVEVLQRLVDAGHTVIVIEHNLDLIAEADWVIDLGPEGGEAGGQIVAEGTPEQVANVAESHTGRYLRSLLRLQGSKVTR